MIFITGPLYSGKRDYAKQFHTSGQIVYDVQDMVNGDMSVQDIETLATELANNNVVIATEIGGGVVPTDANERAYRENAGRLSCLLAEKADTVIRVFCGLPVVLKGELPK